MDHESQHPTLELVRDTRWPSFKFGLGLTLALFILSTMLTIILIVRIGDLLAHEAAAGSFVGQAARFIQMIPDVMKWLRVVAGAGAFVAAIWLGPRLKHSGDYESMAAIQRVRALMIGALHRILIVLALVIGLIPLPVAARYQANARVAETGCFVFTTVEEVRAAFDESMGYMPPDGSDCASLSDPRLLEEALLAVLPAVGWLGVILLSTALGAAVALSRHVVASLVVLCGITIALLAVLTVLGPFVGLAIMRRLPPPPIWRCHITCMQWVAWPPGLTIRLVGALAPFIIAGGVMAWTTATVSGRTHAQTGDPA